MRSRRRMAPSLKRRTRLFRPPFRIDAMQRCGDVILAVATRIRTSTVRHVDVHAAANPRSRHLDSLQTCSLRMLNDEMHSRLNHHGRSLPGSGLATARISNARLSPSLRIGVGQIGRPHGRADRMVLGEDRRERLVLLVGGEHLDVLLVGLARG